MLNALYNTEYLSNTRDAYPENPEIQIWRTVNWRWWKIRKRPCL